MIELPKLPYDVKALEPVISEKTFSFHYAKHHQAYVDNLNKLLPGSAFENAVLEEMVMRSEGGIFNNAAQVWNHTFYFHSFSPNGSRQPSGELAERINRDFGSFDAFKEAFTKMALTQFGSGWAWLTVDQNGKLEVSQTANAGNPMREGKKPLLTCDVWEHAYYLDYQNRRPDYVAKFWDVVDWDIVSGRL